MNMQRTLTLLYGLLLSSTLLWAQTEPRLGVNTPTPQHTLDVNGAINIAPDSAYQINGTPVLRTQLVTSFGDTFTNLYLGPQAGQNNTIGRFNHFSGLQAGQSNTTGSFNYFNGYEAGRSNTTGSLNYFSGLQAGTRNTTGGQNHFSGIRAGVANTTGERNYFNGYGAGRSNTTGSQNYFSGFQAGDGSTTGTFNYFSGYEAGLSNTTGSQNYFSGTFAGTNNRTGSQNLGIGFGAGPTVGDLTNAGAIGYRAQVSQSNSLVLGGTGQDAVQVGIGTTAPQYTLDVQGTTGLSGDVTIGGKLTTAGTFTPGSIDLPADSAYQINGTPVLRTQLVTSFGNTYTNLYFGPEAGQNNTTGGNNYFSGYQAGLANTTGSNNYFSGYQAGQSNTTGERNHFSGYLVGLSNTTGNQNHFSGYEAGRNNSTGRENVYLGYRAGRSGNFTNAIAIGANVNARGNNTVTIGNSSMTSIGGYADWSTLSDGRFKREVAEDVPGLDFVTRLRPVSYRVDRAALHAFLKGEAVENGKTAQEQPRETGFIAQEVEEVANTLGYTFNGIIQPQSENDHYQLSYATFVVPLVQAVQEQQELIEASQAENTRLT